MRKIRNGSTANLQGTRKGCQGGLQKRQVTEMQGRKDLLKMDSSPTKEVSSIVLWFISYCGVCDSIGRA